MAPVSRHENWSVILRLEDIQRVTKIIKRVNNESYKLRFEKLRLITLLEGRMRVDLIEISW